DHRDDRRDRHDVAQHRHEGSQLVGPDGLKRDQDGIDNLVHLLDVDRVRVRLVFCCCSLTSPPSASSRTELNGPVMTGSPAFSPLSTSKYCSPAIPTLTGVKTPRPPLT